MRNIFTLILLVLSATLLTGCGHVKVTGKIMFPDDSPITSGTVMFEDDQHSYTATIQSDGSFSMGIQKDGEGIPRGEYRVAVVAIEPSPGFKPKDYFPRPLVHPKYLSSKTSGITYTIQKKTNVEIVVEKPAK